MPTQSLEDIGTDSFGDKPEDEQVEEQTVEDADYQVDEAKSDTRSVKSEEKVEVKEPKDEPDEEMQPVAAASNEVDDEQEDDDDGADSDEEAMIDNINLLMSDYEKRLQQSREKGKSVNENFLAKLAKARSLLTATVEESEEEVEVEVATPMVDLCGDKPGTKSGEIQTHEVEEEPEHAVRQPAVPQARAFMEEKGYASFGEIKNGTTLIHECCYESTTRLGEVACRVVSTSSHCFA